MDLVVSPVCTKTCFHIVCSKVTICFGYSATKFPHFFSIQFQPDWLTRFQIQQRLCSILMVEFITSFGFGGEVCASQLWISWDKGFQLLRQYTTGSSLDKVVWFSDPTQVQTNSCRFNWCHKSLNLSVSIFFSNFKSTFRFSISLQEIWDTEHLLKIEFLCKFPEH